MVCHRLAPSAYAACRSDAGIDRNASCEVMITTGRLRSVKVQAPANTTGPSGKEISMVFKPRIPPISTYVFSLSKIPNIREKTVKPRMPYTIDGTPAKFEIFSWMNFVINVGLEYSSRYTAAPTPSGTAIRVVNPTSQRLPHNPGIIPESMGSSEFP